MAFLWVISILTAYYIWYSWVSGCLLSLNWCQPKLWESLIWHREPYLYFWSSEDVYYFHLKICWGLVGFFGEVLEVSSARQPTTEGIIPRERVLSSVLCQEPSGQPLIARWLLVEHRRQHPPSGDIPVVVGGAVGCPADDTSKTSLEGANWPSTRFKMCADVPLLIYTRNCWLFAKSKVVDWF